MLTRRESSRSDAGARLEPAADRVDDPALGLLVALRRLFEDTEDPAREHLLDRAVERHRRELRGDVVAEGAVALRQRDDPADQRVGLADRGEVAAPERVRGAGDL